MPAMHTARFRVPTLFIATALALGGACSEELDTSEDTELEQHDEALGRNVAIKTVTPNRQATLALGNGATLSIPRGALRRSTEVRFEQARGRLARQLIDALEERDPFTDQYEAVSAPYILAPHDALLLKEVSVSLPLARARDSSLAVLWLEDESSRSWKELATVEPRGNRATFPLHYFGVVIVAKKTAAPPVDSGAYDAGIPDADLPPDAQGPVDATLPDAGEQDAGLPSCGASQPGVFVARVVDATTPSLAIADTAVVVLDDATGLPVQPSIQAVSNSDGCVRLPIGSLSSFGIKALGNTSYTDTYTYHYRADDLDPLIRMGGNNIAVVVPVLAAFEPRTDRAPVVGAVNWRTSGMPFYELIGCAHIEDEGGDIVAQDLRYFSSQVPSSTTEWPLENGTNPQNGRFFIGNMTPGLHTLTARLADGTLLGSSTLTVFPRSTASTQVNGASHNLFFGGIFIDAPAGTPKPGCQP